MFKNIVDEQKLTDGLMVIVNRFVSRIQDEILDKKRVKLTVTATVEVVDKDDKEK